MKWICIKECSVYNWYLNSTNYYLANDIIKFQYPENVYHTKVNDIELRGHGFNSWKEAVSEYIQPYDEWLAIERERKIDGLLNDI